MPRWVVGVVVSAAVGCVRPSLVNPADHLSFAFEARPTWGEVRVVPVLAVHHPVELNLDSYLGAALPHHRQSVRRARTRELAEVPDALARALPGEVNGRLGLAWRGQFRSHHFPSGAYHHVADALTGQRPDLTAVLGNAARAVGGEATLFSWVRQLEGEPLSLRGFPGEVIQTSAGPVVLDHEDEPYLVTARVGMALVTRDGEVVLRYEDTYDAILSGREGAADAGRSLAHALAEEVVMVWATDPRLQAWGSP